MAERSPQVMAEYTAAPSPADRSPRYDRFTIRAPLPFEHYGLCALASALLIAVSNLFAGNFHSVEWWDYPAVGVTVAFCLWGGDHIWDRTVGIASTTIPGLLRQVIKIPFWFMMGGIGFVTALLSLQKIGALGGQSIPVEPLFVSGGKAGVITVLVVLIGTQIRLRRKRSRRQPKREMKLDDE